MEDETLREFSFESRGLDPEYWEQLPPILGGNSQKWKLNACIGRQYSADDAAHACTKGYRQAAELIALQLERRPVWMDALVYPFVFNWRHHFELLLKQMVYVCARLNNRDDGVVKGHRILPFWDRIEPSVLERWPSAGPVVPRRCRELLSRLDELDRTGQTFRYTLDNNGQRHLENESLLNIADFNLIAASISDFLSSVYGQFSADLEYKLEAERQAYE